MMMKKRMKMMRRIKMKMIMMRKCMFKMLKEKV